MRCDELSDDEWERVEPLLDDEPARRGRPRAEARRVVNAVLWVLSTGEGWGALPERFPSSPTCRRRFEAWLASGTFYEVIGRLRDGGRRVSLDGRIGPAAAKPLALPRCDSPYVFACRAPASWRAPVKQE